MIGVSVMFSVMNYGLVNCALSSYISASKGVKGFLSLQFRNELWCRQYSLPLGSKTADLSTWLRTVSTQGPRNCGSLGFARDGKGKGDLCIECGSDENTSVRA